MHLEKEAAARRSRLDPDKPPANTRTPPPGATMTIASKGSVEGSGEEETPGEGLGANNSGGGDGGTGNQARVDKGLGVVDKETLDMR